MDALWAVLAIAILLIPLWYSGLRFWFWMTTAITVLVAITEVTALLVTHHTISQQFWAWSLVHPVGSWVFITIPTVAWLGLMVHLMIKLIRKRK